MTRATLAILLCGSLGLPSVHAESGRGTFGAPATAAARQNPLAGEPRHVQAGRKLYEQHCAGCHGADASGSRRAPALDKPAVVRARPGELFWFLTNGALPAGMPSWAALPDARRWQIVAFLSSLSAGSVSKPRAVDEKSR